MQVVVGIKYVFVFIGDKVVFVECSFVLDLELDCCFEFVGKCWRKWGE